MKDMRSISAYLILISIISFLPGSAISQSKTIEATNWFKVAIKEKDITKKIEYYTKAIQLDPTFVEALYNLGILYKKQQDYERAEQFFRSAYNAKPQKIKNDFKFQILYELATTYKNLKRPGDYEGTLRKAKNFTTDKTKRGRILYELGSVLYDQGRYEEALVELQEGQKLRLTNQRDFSELIQATKSNLELQQLYDRAEQEKANGNLREARALLARIQAKNPDFKDVKAKSNELDLLLKVETEKAKEVALAMDYEQAKKYEAAGDLQMAIITYEKLLQNGDNYKDITSKLKKLRQQLAQKEVDKKLENEYANGIAAFKAKNWSLAIIYFEEIMKLNRDYRDVARKLAQAKKEFDRESANKAVASLYSKAVDALKKKDLERAQLNLEKVQKLRPNYRDVDKMLAKINTELQKQAKHATNAHKISVSPSLLDSMYQDALISMEKKEDWLHAIVTLEKIKMLQPVYRDVNARLDRARNYLKENKINISDSQYSKAKSNLLFGLDGTYIAIIMLLLIAFSIYIVFGSTIRAHICLFLGNYERAAQIYEKKIERKPGKMKLYATLAQIYMNLDRDDNQARNVYKIALDSNIPVNLRQKIISFVMQDLSTNENVMRS